jgi:hypothetical protein
MITENLQLLRKRIEEICERVSRSHEDIKLIAVSKTFGAAEIEQALQAGQKEFGENKAQELVSKFEVLGNKVVWHFIGRLQKNKVKYAVRTADFIHSVDSLSLAEEIQKHAIRLEKRQKVLIQVKTSDEETKSGVTEKLELKKIVEYCSHSTNIDLVGLMTISALTNDQNLIRKSFSDLRNLKEELNTEGYNLKELSMGMTSDYDIAIEEGATMLRIGSAIFGQRNNNKK